MKKINYVEQVTNSKGVKVATMHLYKPIGGDGINASDFAENIQTLNVDRLNVRINSGGGGVVEGLGILSAMINFKDQGGELHTYNDGVAASTAGWLLLAAEPKNIHSKDYSLLMLHGVSGDTPNNNFQKAIQKIFKNRSGLDVSSLLSNGEDNFFDASEAANFGFFPIDNIENTGVKLDVPENFTIIDVMNEAQNVIKCNNINSKPLKMKKVINLLGLQEGANEDLVTSAVENAIKNYNTTSTALDEANNAIVEKDATIAELNAKVEASNKLVATGDIQTAIKEGKLNPKSEAETESLVNQALKDPAGFKNMLSMIPIKAANIMDQTQAGKESPSTLVEQIKNRSFRQLEKEDSSLLADIKNSAKSEYVKLYNKQYNTNKTEADF